MKNLVFVLALSFCASAASLSASVQPIGAPPIELADLKPGMKGEVWTVFQGTIPEPFAVEVTGVVKNALGPGKSMIICALNDPRVQAMGAVAGMSGRPLYIEGKFAGALSYQVQKFETVRYADFTPAADLEEVQSKIDSSSGGGSATMVASPGVDSGYQALRPVFTVSGLSPAVAELFSSRFAALGLGATALGGSTGGREFVSLPSAPAALVPGSAISVALAIGDVTLAGTGTVSTVSGDRITAFGHPMMTLGEAELPMLSAEIVTILPSSMQSVKVANSGAVIGTISQDRLSAIGGRLGAGPAMVPVQVSLPRPGGQSRSLNFRVVRNKDLTPSIVAAGVSEAILNSNDAGISQGFRLSSRVVFESGHIVSKDALYSGTQAFTQGLGDFVQALAMNLQNPYEKAFPASVSFTVEPLQTSPIAVLDGFQISRTVAHAGERIQATVSWRDYQGASHRESLEIVARPEWIGKAPDVMLVPGRTLDELSGRPRNIPAAQLRSFDAYVAALNDDRQGDGVYLAVVEKVPVFSDQSKAGLELPGSFERIARGSDESRYQKRDAYVPLFEQHLLPGRLLAAQAVRGLQVIE